VSSLRRRASRARRVHHAARPERLPSAREAAEKLEHHRMVVEAVLTLEEPLRSTVLLRFYEDLPPRRIAEIQAIPVATVRSRLRRAVTRLRLSFDEAYGGDRRAWSLALLPLLLAPGQAAAVSGAGGTTVLSLGGTAMKAKLTFAGLAAGLLGTILIVWWATDPVEQPPARGDTAQRDETVPPPETDVAARRAREEAEALREVYPDSPEGDGAVRNVIGTVKLADERLPLGIEVTLANETRGEDGRLLDDVPRAFDVVLKPGGNLKVRVLGAGQAPLVDQRISISRSGSRESTASRTDAYGEILFENLATGHYRVRRPVPGAEGGQAATRMARVAAGETAEVVFEVSCGLVGTVLDEDGRPLPQAFVRLVPVKFGEEGYRNVQTRTDDEGAFEAQGFPPGEYSVSIQVVGKRSFSTEVARLTFKGGDRLEQVLQVKRTLIAGRITRADTGEALAGVRQVTLQAYRIEVEDGEFKRRLGHGSFATPNQDGRYAFPGLQPGHYRIWVHPRDKSLKPVKRIIDFTTGGTLGHLDFVLETRNTGTLRLEVVGPDGRPATGLNFSLILEKKEREDGGVSTLSSSMHAKEAGNGIYDFELEAGEREVHVWGPGYRTATLTVSIGKGGTAKRKLLLREREDR